MEWIQYDQGKWMEQQQRRLLTSRITNALLLAVLGCHRML